MPWIITPTAALAPGMTVAKNVEASGTVLLTTGTILTSSHIQRLVKWDVKSVAIADANGSSTESTVQNDELYAVEKERRAKLLSTVENDPQVEILKAAVFEYLERRYRGNK
jgi:hypothetical protein